MGVETHAEGPAFHAPEFTESYIGREVGRLAGGQALGIVLGTIHKSSRPVRLRCITAHGVRPSQLEIGSDVEPDLPVLLLEFHIGIQAAGI